MPTVPISTFVLRESIATLPCCFGSYLAQPIYRYLCSLSTDICRKRNTRRTLLGILLSGCSMLSNQRMLAQLRNLCAQSCAYDK
jgi:hypothetical protein